MLHLFAGIQLMPDILAVRGGRAYMISTFVDDYDWQADKELLKAQFDSSDRAIVNVNGYNELVGKKGVYKTDLEFFEDVYNHAWERVGVYADVQNFAILTCKYLRLMLPNITRDTAYLIYKLSLDKFYYKYVYLQNIVSGFMLVNPVDLKGKLKRLSEKDFLYLFDSTKLSGSEDDRNALREKLKGEGSTEYQIAAMFCGDNSYDDYLEYQLKNVVLSHIRGMIKELQTLVFPNVYCIEGNTVKTDFEEALRKAELSDILTSTETILKEKVTDFETVKDTVNKVVEYFAKHQDDLRWDGQNTKEAQTYTNFAWLADIINEKKTARDIINECLGTRDASYFGDLLYSYSGRDNINLMLLFYIYELYNKGDIEHLKEFVM